MYGTSIVSHLLTLRYQDAQQSQAQATINELKKALQRYVLPEGPGSQRKVIALPNQTFLAELFGFTLPRAGDAQHPVLGNIEWQDHWLIFDQFNVCIGETSVNLLAPSH
jgi:hypothetical protein